MKVENATAMWPMNEWFSSNSSMGTNSVICFNKVWGHMKYYVLFKIRIIWRDFLDGQLSEKKVVEKHEETQIDRECN